LNVIQHIPPKLNPSTDSNKLLHILRDMSFLHSDDLNVSYNALDAKDNINRSHCIKELSVLILTVEHNYICL